MGIFSRTVRSTDPLDIAARRYHTARTNILFLVVLTLVNLALQLAGSFTYFLFSASIPYYLVDMGRFLCGKYPEEVYGGLMTEADFLGGGFLALMIAIALIILAVYALLYFFSKQVRVGLMVTTLVLFALDTLMMLYLYGFAIDMIIDYGFHIYIIVAQVLGIRAAVYLKNAAAAGVCAEGADTVGTDENSCQ